MRQRKSKQPHLSEGRSNAGNTDVLDWRFEVIKQLQRFLFIYLFSWTSPCPSSRGVTPFYPVVYFRRHAALEDIQTGQDPPEQPESLHFYTTKEKVRSLLRLGGQHHVYLHHNRKVSFCFVYRAVLLCEKIQNWAWSCRGIILTSFSSAQPIL